MHTKDPTPAAKRRDLHEQIVIEAGALYAALDRQLEAGETGDLVAAAQHERRFVRAQLVLAELCGTTSAYYREGSTTHLVASLAAAALGWAAWRHPELVGAIRAELAAEKAAAEVPAAPVRYLVEAFEAPICDGGGTKYAVIDSKAEHPPGIVHDGPAYKETRDEQVAQGWADELNASTVGGAR